VRRRGTWQRSPLFCVKCCSSLFFGVVVEGVADLAEGWGFRQVSRDMY
jgi:predicted metal-binding membrane protein